MFLNCSFDDVDTLLNGQINNYESLLNRLEPLIIPEEDDMDNQNIINDYFKNLTCDDYKESIFKGWQSFADQALNSLDISGYAKKRNNV